MFLAVLSRWIRMWIAIIAFYYEPSATSSVGRALLCNFCSSPKLAVRQRGFLRIRNHHSRIMDKVPQSLQLQPTRSSLFQLRSLADSMTDTASQKSCRDEPCLARICSNEPVCFEVTLHVTCARVSQSLAWHKDLDQCDSSTNRVIDDTGMPHKG